MKVKIGNIVYNAKDEPIMIVLSDKDKENITNMDPKLTKYCAFPEGIDDDVIEKFMNIEDE